MWSIHFILPLLWALQQTPWWDPITSKRFQQVVSKTAESLDRCRVDTLAKKNKKDKNHQIILFPTFTSHFSFHFSHFLSILISNYTYKPRPLRQISFPFVTYNSDLPTILLGSLFLSISITYSNQTKHTTFFSKF